MAQGAASGANPVEAIRHFYNCDMNEPGEFLPSSSLPPIDPSVVSYQQRLEEIVARRDSAMASKINQTLHQSSSKDRLFFAVGFCKRGPVSSIDSAICLRFCSASDESEWYCR